MLVKYRVILVVIFLVTLGLYKAEAQQSGTASPYSRYGIGDLQSVEFVRVAGMGGTTIALREDTFPSQINFNNPASYSSLQHTTFDFGAKAQFVRLENNSTTQDKQNVSFSYFSLGFPIKKLRGGCSFGLRRYSQVGYQMSESKELTDIGQANFTYTGEGGLNQFYAGTGFSIIEDSVHTLALGFNASYLFGALSYVRQVEPDTTDSNILNLQYSETTNLGGMYFDYGLQYKVKFKNNLAIGLGFTHALNKDIKGSLTSVAERYVTNSLGNPTFQDTAFYSKNTGGSVTIPQAFGVGFSIQKGTKWLFAADYKLQNWSKYEAFGQKDNLADSWRGSCGFEYTPNRFERAPKSFFQKTSYRLGGYYSTTYLQLNGTQLNDYGVTLGLGLPLPTQVYSRGSISHINLALELGQRGTLASNLIKEGYINIRLGFTLNDGGWFIRRKYD